MSTTYQVTDWSYPNDTIKTVDGQITWQAYLRKEQQRWASHGRDCEIREENGEMALFAKTGRGWMPAETEEES